jgi:sarcosine oxidase subunit beta
VQHASGLREAHAVTASDVGALHPLVATDDVIGGAFCPTDGFISPTGLLTGYLQGAIRAGAAVRWGSEVIALEREGGRVVGVRTGSGRVDGDIVVNAAGAWAGALAAASGLELPVVPLRRQVASTVLTTVVAPWMPMTIFTRDGFHFRERDGRVLLLCPSPGSPGAPFDTSVDDQWLRTVAATAHARVPALRDVPLDRPACWAGLYEMSPDKHAILGAAPGCDRAFFINGSSGHGVMHAPALAHLLTEIILDGHASTIDVTPLRPSRFAEGDLNPLSDVL